MKSKKSQTLANKLIDDLLADDLQGDESSPSSDTFNAQDMSEPFYVAEDEGSVSEVADDATMNLADKNNAEKNESKADKTAVATRKLSPVPEDSQPTVNTGSRLAQRSGRSSDYQPLGHELQLVQSENLRVAQHKINELETELSRLRLENEELAAAADTLRKMVEDLKGQLEQTQAKIRDSVETYRAERDVLLQSASAKDRSTQELKQKIQELETRLTSNVHKIRNRERELENRLELVKVENQALLRSKDEYMLELKRQLDQSRLEIENYRNKSQELKKRFDEKQEILRRTVKTLRLALTMLEGEEDGTGGTNKAS